jgi:hypothetical protein
MLDAIYGHDHILKEIAAQFSYVACFYLADIYSTFRKYLLVLHMCILRVDYSGV